MKQMSQVPIRLETESNGSSRSAKKTQMAGSLFILSVTPTLNVSSLLVTSWFFGWDGLKPALKPAARKLGGALGW